MNENAPLYVSVLFISLVGVVFIYLTFTIYAALKKENTRFAISKIGIFAAILLVWLTLISTLAYNEIFLNLKEQPQKIAMIMGPSLISIFSFLFFFRKTRFFKSISLVNITYLQSFRLIIEGIIFYGLLEAQLIPELMTLSGRNPDLLVGLSAPFIAFLYSRKTIGDKGLLVWNGFSLLLLINIIVNAVLSIPTPFQLFAFDQPNIAILYFPYILLPTFLVATALFGHLFSLIRIRQHKSELSQNPRAYKR